MGRELQNYQKRTQTYALEDFLPDLTFLAYVSPWDPSHWIRNVFLIKLGTGNTVIRHKQMNLSFSNLDYRFMETLKYNHGPLDLIFNLHARDMRL